MKRKQVRTLWMHVPLVIMILSLAVLLTACIGSPDGYIAITPSQITYIQFDQNNTVGVLKSVSMTATYPKQVKTIASPFTGKQNGSAFTLTFTTSELASSAQGTLNGNLVTLSLVSVGGVGKTVHLEGVSSQQYTQAVTALQQSALKANKIHATQVAGQTQQQAVISENRYLKAAVVQLQKDESAYKAIPIKDIISRYDADIAQMQQLVSYEESLGSGGCANALAVDAQDAAVSNVYTDVQSLDTQTDTAQVQHDGLIAALQADITSINVHWTLLQQAVTENSLQVPPAVYTQAQLTQILKDESTLEASLSPVWKDVPGKRVSYDNKATALNQQADVYAATGPLSTC